MGILDKIDRGMGKTLVPFGMKAAAKSIKKAKGHFRNLPQVDDRALKAGDILIVKDFSPKGHDIDSDGIRAGQALFSRMSNGGNCASEHALIVRADGKPHVIEATGRGAHERDFISARHHAVYRYNGEAASIICREAVAVANFLCDGYRLDAPGRVAIANQPNVGYAAQTKLAASIFRSKFRGASYHYRIKALAELYETQRYYPAGKYNMICSEFVATCYEVAAWVSHALSPLEADPRAMTAKALESRLNRKNFELVGRYQGKVAQKTYQQFLGATMLGPLIQIADREFAAQNTLTRIESDGSQFGKAAVEAAGVTIAGKREIVATISLSQKFKFKNIALQIPGVYFADEGRYEYFYTNASNVFKKQGCQYMALRAPKG